MVKELSMGKAKEIINMLLVTSLTRSMQSTEVKWMPKIAEQAKMSGVTKIAKRTKRAGLSKFTTLVIDWMVEVMN